MEFAFYFAAIVAVATTVRVVTCANAVHALMYLIVSLLSVAIVFYALGAPFAAALEVIVYAGAIMVLFVFVIMMLNLNEDTLARERAWISPGTWIGPGVVCLLLLGVLLVAMSGGPSFGSVDGTPLMAERVGRTMFGPYVLVVELAAFVLLAALVVAAHLGRDERDAAEEQRTNRLARTRKPSRSAR